MILLRLFFRILFRVELTGDMEALRAPRLLLLVHQESVFDALFLGLFLPLDPTLVLSREIAQRGWLHWLLRRFDTLVLDLSNPISLKKLIRRVQEDRPLVLFPEDRVTHTGGLMKLYDVPALVAVKTGAAVVPVRITGTSGSVFGGIKGRRWFPRIRLCIEPAIRLTVDARSPARMRRRQAGQQMLALMQRSIMSSLRPRTLFEAFLDAVKTHGRARRVLEDMKGEQSYGQLLKTSLALGRFACRVSKEQETVGVLLPNLIVTVCLFLGLSAMRRIPAMLNYSSGIEAIRGACTAANIRTVITSREFLEAAKLHAVVPSLNDVKLVYLEDARKSFTLADKLWLLRALWRPRQAMCASDPNEPAVVLYTSGSEGKPKGVALSHKAILSNIAQIRAAVDVVPSDKFLNALPIYHSYGLTACALLPLLGGARVFIYISPLHYRTIPEIAGSRKCTFLFGTSTFLDEYAKVASPKDFQSLRYVISGAEKLSEEVARTWLEKFGLRIMEGYGATECAPVLAVNSNLAYRRGAVGRFLQGIEFHLQKIPGIGHGSLLHVRGPNVMLGYYLQERPGELQSTHSEFGPGWYNTGDVVEVDEDGFVTVIGRIKRFAKVAGEMVSLEVVEKIAGKASPQHRHAAIIHVVESGESTMLFTTDPELSRMRLHSAARELGAQDLAVARRIVHMQELPLLGSGKTDYRALQNLTQAEESR